MFLLYLIFLNTTYTHSYNNLGVPKKYLKHKINTISQIEKRKEQNTNRNCSKNTYTNRI